MSRVEAPLLDKTTLFQMLERRFGGKFSKLSDIPHPSLLHDAQKAAKRLADAVRTKERITLVGDYDVDGVTSTSICVLFFREIGYPLQTVIPNRFKDGYGVSPKVLERIDADVVFTVDNGITAIEAADICKNRGIDLIITDHHTPSKVLPDAYAIVNPKLDVCSYPFKDICGAQVAWLLLGLIKKELHVDVDMMQYLELLALAIVADVMPLVGINRAIVQGGLKQMMKSKRASSVIIREYINKSRLSSEDIGFQIAPRLNAAGRLEDASLAMEFLTARDEDEAFEKFELLNKLNDLRKTTEAETTEIASLHVSSNDKIIVAYGEGWHEGVVGIIASRLVGQFNRPAIVLSCDGENAKGSARSLANVDIYKLISTQKKYLQKFGGHKMAAGLSLHVKDIEAFKKEINEEAQKLDPDDFILKEDIIGVIQSSCIDFELLDILEKFEPYGEANPRPRFLVKDAEVLGIKLFGADHSHSRVNLRFFQHERQSHELLAFREVLSMPEDRKLTCSYTVNKNEFNGRVSIQLMIERIY